MASGVGLDPELLISAVNEFYTTSDEGRRHEIDRVLCNFKSDYEIVATVGTCMRMISQSTSSPSVRYFGAVSLYDVIRIRSTEYIANETLQMSVKTFLIDSLASGVHAQSTSVLNKLSASLALFSLYCVPDLWPTPVQDLTSVLAPTPEVLLKVLSDMAAEFSHVSMPLPQRSKLKALLHTFSENIIQVLTVVLRPGGSDASTITRQAAVECVEQWLRLPGMALDQWTNVLSDVLGAVVEDCTALASILDIIAENDEFASHTTLIINICQYICLNVSTKIEEELREDATSEEIAALVAATCSVAEKSVSTLVEMATQASDTELVIRLSQVMQVLSNMPGRYPQEEIVSDLPAVFFISLRTEIMSIVASSASSTPPIDEQFVRQLAQIYAQLLDVAIEKLAFPPAATWHTWNLADREQFEGYRKMRSEVSYDSYHFAAPETLGFLNEKLEEALNCGDVNRSESCLYMWECVADYLGEEDYPAILKCLEMVANRLAAPSTSSSSSSSSSTSSTSTSCPATSSGATTSSGTHSTPEAEDVDRRGATIMRLLYGLSHLVQEHDEAKQLECALIPLILTYIDPRWPCARRAVDTLIKFVEDRTASLDMIGDRISATCYDYFNSPQVDEPDRLAALKCIGYVLSRRRPDETMKIIGQILSQQNIDEPGIDVATRQRRYAFQINTFSALFASLPPKKSYFPPPVHGASRSKNAQEQEAEEPTIVQLLREAIPVFETLCSGGASSGSAGAAGANGELIQEVCNAVRAALGSLPDGYQPAFFPFVVSLLNSALFVPESAAAACALAKSAVLQCGNLVGVEMVNAVADWLAAFEQHVGSPSIDEYLQLVSHVVRKSWKAMRRYEEPSIAAFRSAINVCVYTLVSSGVPCEVRTAAQTLAAFSSFTALHDDASMKAVLAETGKQLIQAIFGRIQTELSRPTVEALAEILFFYFRTFTTETRAVLNEQPYGGSPLITQLFREIGNFRVFKQTAIRFNSAALRDPGSI